MPIYNLTSEKIIELNQQHKDKETAYSTFLNLFSKKSKDNEKILHELLK